MANPRKKNGYTPIANEIMEALAKTRIPGEARQILDVIIRNTYGYNKKIDWITTSQFTEKTGLSNMAVYKARRKLKKMNIITISKKGDSQYLTYCLQKNYDNWILPPKKEVSTKKGDRLPPKKEIDYLQKRTKTTSQKVRHKRHKDNVTKDNITKDRFNYLLDPLFVNVFESYLKTRRTKATDLAKELILEDLHKVSQAEAIAMLEQSIKNGWTGVFPLKKEIVYGGKKGDSQQYAGLEKEVN